MRVRVLLGSAGLSLGLLLLPIGVLAASADDGSPGAPAPASPSFRPPAGVLRHVDAAMLRVDPTVLRPARPELVMLVGGYQSCACPDDGTFDEGTKRVTADGTFDELTKRLIASGFVVRRFGQDPRFPYDTFGRIGPSAVNLRDEIRALAPDYDAVHIVTHSMGGVVADRAFADGLSRDDGVASYVSWSAPHSGSDAARALAIGRVVAGTHGDVFRESLLWLGMESESDAARDLAAAYPVAPPPGVVRLDLRESTDVLVTDRDAVDPGVPSRILSGVVDGRPIEGHGGILTDPAAIDLTMLTIASRRVPPETRPAVVVGATEQESRVFSAAALALICVVGLAICVGAFVFRDPLRFATGIVSRVIPGASRRPCV